MTEIRQRILQNPGFFIKIIIFKAFYTCLEVLRSFFNYKRKVLFLKKSGLIILFFYKKGAHIDHLFVHSFSLMYH